MIARAPLASVRLRAAGTSCRPPARRRDRRRRRCSSRRRPCPARRGCTCCRGSRRSPEIGRLVSAVISLRARERLVGLLDPDVARALEGLEEGDVLAVRRDLRARDLGVAEEQLAVDQRRLGRDGNRYRAQANSRRTKGFIAIELLSEPGKGRVKVDPGLRPTRYDCRRNIHEESVEVPRSPSGLAHRRRAGRPASAGHARRRFHRQAARHRAQRHRQRARRPDVARAPAAVFQRARYRSAGRHDVHVAEDSGPSRDHAHTHPGVRARCGPTCCCTRRAGRRPASSTRRVYAGQTGYGMAATGAGQTSEGAKAMIARGGSRRSAALVDRALGRRQHAGAGAADGARDPRRPRKVATLRRASCASIRSPTRTMPGRGSAANSRRLYYIVIAVHAGRRRILLRDLDRHQRRQLLPQLRGRGRLDGDQRVAGQEHSRQRAARARCYPRFAIHHGRRHAVVSRPDRQRAERAIGGPIGEAGAGATCAGSRAARRTPIWTQGGDDVLARHVAGHRSGVDGRRVTSRTRRPSGAGARPSRTISPRAWTGRSRTSLMPTTTRSSR